MTTNLIQGQQMTSSHMSRAIKKGAENEPPKPESNHDRMVMAVTAWAGLTIGGGIAIGYGASSGEMPIAWIGAAAAAIGLVWLVSMLCLTLAQIADNTQKPTP